MERSPRNRIIPPKPRTKDQKDNHHPILEVAQFPVPRNEAPEHPPTGDKWRSFPTPIPVSGAVLVSATLARAGVEAENEIASSSSLQVAESPHICDGNSRISGSRF